MRGHFVLLCYPILLFGPRRSHSSVPARSSPRPARGAAVKDGLWPPEGLVLDGREPAGRLPGAGIGRVLVLVVDRREIAERGMGDAFVVARAPTRQSISGLAEIVEDRLIEQFVAHSAIERFPDPLRIGLPGAMKC